jgi:hypothetical protein
MAAIPNGLFGVIARKNAGGSGSPGTTNLIAWYDFNNSVAGEGNDDSHAAFDLTEISTPTYQSASSPEYGITTEGTPGAYFRQTSLDDSFANTAGDWSYVMRWRAHTSIADNNDVFSGNGNRTRIIYKTAGIETRLATVTSTSTVGGVINTWYTTVVSWDASAAETSVSVNGETYVATGGTGAYSTGSYVFGGFSTGQTRNINLDFMGFYSQTLSQDEADWFYNSGGTRVYGDL